MNTPDITARACAHFGAHAQNYLDSPVHAAGPDLERMQAIVGQRPAAVALDVGCGAGHVSYHLAPLVDRVVAVDPSAAMLATVEAEAKRRGLCNISVQEGSAEALIAPPGGCDVAVTRMSAHHWASLATGLQRMRAALKPGGVAILMDTVSPAGALAQTWLQSFELLRDTTHVRDYTVEEWRAQLAAAGFAVEEVNVYPLRTEFGAWFARAHTPLELELALRRLARSAPQEVRNRLQLDEEIGFTLETMLISARAV